MAKKRWGFVLLVLILVALFWLRMELSTDVEGLSYDSYLTLRHVEHIRETGSPIVEDPLSLTGRDRVGSPVFAYLLAGLSFLGPLVYKAVPNLFMVLLLVPVFYLVRSYTKSDVTALLSVVLAGSAPAVFSSYLNTPSSSPLAIGLFLTILVMLQESDEHLYWIVGLTLFLTFLSPLVSVLVLSLLFIIVLLRLEGFGVDKRMGELFLFTLLLAIWYHVLVYKRAMFTEGIEVLWQNLPARYMALQFGPVTFIDLIYGLGVVTFLFGVFGTYHALFEKRVKEAYTVIGAELAVLLMLLLRVIELKLGLLILSLLLAAMAGYGLLVSARYLQRTKFPRLVYPFAVLTLLLFIVTAFLPGIERAEVSLQNTPHPDDVEAFEELDLPKGAVLLTTVREGAAVQHYSGHTTVTDDDFLMLRNPEELIRDIDSVYNARFAVSLPAKAEKLGFTHILFSSAAAEQYGRPRIYVDEHACVSSRQVTSTTLLYRILCRSDTR